MSTRKHTPSLKLTAPPERVFAMLITPSAIRGFWGAARALVLAKEGGFWASAWGEREDDPDFVSLATIKVFDPPRRILFGDFQYHAKTGSLPFMADITTEFIVEPHGAGSILRVIHDGFPVDAIADEFYAGCEVGWRNTFEGIKLYLSESFNP